MSNFVELSAGIALFLVAPIAIQEMVMALWMIIKGFNESEIKKK